jgi:hypothetical protein
MPSLDPVRTRFPGARISGFGEWAAVSRCWPHVAEALFQTEEQARALVATGKCRCEPCIGKHEVIRIKIRSSVWEDPDDREWERNRAATESRR